MSSEETKKLYEGKDVTAEADSRTGRALGRPIYFKQLRNGHYLTIEQAETLADELRDAALCARKART